jgi:hypothetical protein
MVARDVTPARVRELSHQLEVWEIARILGVSVDEVEDLLDQARQPRVPVTLIDHKTGRWHHVTSWRAAYFKVCLLGLTDWSWHSGHWRKEEAGHAVVA